MDYYWADEVPHVHPGLLYPELYLAERFENRKEVEAVAHADVAHIRQVRLGRDWLKQKWWAPIVKSILG